MATRFNAIKKIFILLVFFSLNSLFAEYYSLDEYDFYIDLPEGFSLTEVSPQKDSYFFETKIMPVKFGIKIYSTEKYEDASLAMEKSIEQLKSENDEKCEIESFTWFDRKVFLSSFSFTLPDSTKAESWALSFSVKNKKTGKDEILFLLTFADSKISYDCEQFMFSILDSISLCKEDFRRPGPITDFAFPVNSYDSVMLNIGSGAISSLIPRAGIERSKFVIDREYAVLRIYANQKNWKEAWQRYYRTIFRESYSTFDIISTDILKNRIQEIKDTSSDSNEVTVFIQMLLDWVQDFEYIRDTKHADFTSPAEAVQGIGSDCDSRSMLMCIILEHMGIQTKLFVSREYSHAVFGAFVKCPGALINVDGNDYVLGETTAKVNFGLIAQEQNDTKKWIPVDWM